ncbi:FAD-dependent oxidoreductase, partial [Pigmentiphaga sp. NML030171]|uniref:FAD-dependent oxidoreductase n=1 Tax=Pigmentiphaga sp. NML030171 TaxID=2008676 RepID=UPI0034E83E0C
MEDLRDRWPGPVAPDRKLSGPRRAAVVGAGWAGLAAAHVLAGRGYAVTVYEAAREVGGRARTVAARPGGPAPQRTPGSAPGAAASRRNPVRLGAARRQERTLSS